MSFPMERRRAIMRVAQGVCYMRLFSLPIVLAAWLNFPATPLAQENTNRVVVASVVGVNPQPDGQSYLLTVILGNGQHLSLQVPSAEAVKISDGLTKTAGTGASKSQIVTI